MNANFQLLPITGTRTHSRASLTSDILFATFMRLLFRIPLCKRTLVPCLFMICLFLVLFFFAGGRILCFRSLFVSLNQRVYVFCVVKMHLDTTPSVQDRRQLAHFFRREEARVILQDQLQLIGPNDREADLTETRSQFVPEISGCGIIDAIRFASILGPDFTAFEDQVLRCRQVVGDEQLLQVIRLTGSKVLGLDELTHILPDLVPAFGGQFLEPQLFRLMEDWDHVLPA